MIRLLSHSEMRALTTCEAQWDFRYGGALAGDALGPKTVAPRLREGRAWGRAVAAFHAGTEIDAQMALNDALREDADEQRLAGVYFEDDHVQMTVRLTSILLHYMATAEPMVVTEAERHFEVPIPSRSGGRSSSRYRLMGYLDGVTVEDGRTWIVENKLRGTLSSFEQLALDRQGRRYAWAWWRETGDAPAGVIYNERLNEAPKRPRILKDGSPSRDKAQLCTAESYLQVCREAGVEPNDEAVAHFEARVWQSRQRIIFRPGELAETGAELVSLARRVSELESGRMPIREPHPAHCRGCAFASICPNPSDDALVDALFTRLPAKRLRQEVTHAA